MFFFMWFWIHGILLIYLQILVWLHLVFVRYYLKLRHICSLFINHISVCWLDFPVWYMCALVNGSILQVTTTIYQFQILWHCFMWVPTMIFNWTHAPRRHGCGPRMWATGVSQMIRENVYISLNIFHVVWCFNTVQLTEIYAGWNQGARFIASPAAWVHFIAS